MKFWIYVMDMIATHVFSVMEYVGKSCALYKNLPEKLTNTYHTG